MKCSVEYILAQERAYNSKKAAEEKKKYRKLYDIRARVPDPFIGTGRDQSLVSVNSRFVRNNSRQGPAVIEIPHSRIAEIGELRGVARADSTLRNYLPKVEESRR